MAYKHQTTHPSLPVLKWCYKNFFPLIFLTIPLLFLHVHFHFHSHSYFHFNAACNFPFREFYFLSLSVVRNEPHNGKIAGKIRIWVNEPTNGTRNTKYGIRVHNVNSPKKKLLFLFFSEHLPLPGQQRVNKKMRRWWMDELNENWNKKMIY